MSMCCVERSQVRALELEVGSKTQTPVIHKSNKCSLVPVFSLKYSSFSLEIISGLFQKSRSFLVHFVW